jgi:hypothetical protein
MTLEEKLKKGDIYDIGQTVNGVSRFLYLDNKWYYARSIVLKYNYDDEELTNLILEETPLGLDYVKLIGNIFDDIQLRNGLDFSKCPEVLLAIRDNKLNELL